MKRCGFLRFPWSAALARIFHTEHSEFQNADDDAGRNLIGKSRSEVMSLAGQRERRSATERGYVCQD
jgi:hypothetical protein